MKFKHSKGKFFYTSAKNRVEIYSGAHTGTAPNVVDEWYDNNVQFLHSPPRMG